MPPLGYSQVKLSANRSPTSLDIAWVAGFYEGEGSCGWKHTDKIQVPQSEDGLMVLKKCVELFGGSISRRGGNGTKKGKLMYEWHIHGSRARAFSMTIYKFLSPKRQNQIRRWLRWRR